MSDRYNPRLSVVLFCWIAIAVALLYLDLAH